jgi:hypothetical protein
MTIDITIAKPARQTLPALSAAHLALTMACFVLLLAPALWNSYPLLQYDTGGYLARWYEGYLVPSRSTAFGLFLHLGEGMHFWPDLLLQTGCAIWVISLVLRVTGLVARPWHRISIITWLSLVTALPFLSSALLTDIFAGVGVLALYLLIYHQPDLRRGERIGVFFLIAFAAATHIATLLVLVAVLGFAIVCLLPSDRRRMAVLLSGGGALATGAAMLVATNFAFSGQLAWTPGGFGIAFGRMLQDGIVKRYLDEHCPNARLKLCPYRDTDNSGVSSSSI